MTAREERERPGQPGTTADPNQANREPARDRGPGQVHETPKERPDRPREEDRGS